MERVIAARRESAMAEALAGALVLAVGMGFGRFAFTGLYPLMVRDGTLSVQGGSLAASANYLGYLIGALLLSRVHHRHSAALCRLAVAGTVLCLAALALPWGGVYVDAVRFAAGLFSALAMITASMWLFQHVGFHRGAPTLYAGVGVGILLSAELIAAGDAAGQGSGTIWLLLAGAATVLAALSWPRLRDGAGQRVAEDQALSDSGLRDGAPFHPWLLIGLYSLAGFGYIVTATYLPLFVRGALGQVNPLQVWAAFGLGAAPSCFLWHALQHRLGARRALLLNLLVQAAGVLLPVLSSSAPAFLASALLVGGTFVGTVTIAMPAARRAAVGLPFNMMATMTAGYGVGQIAGPLLSGALLAHYHSFHPPLLAAAAALLLAALGCIL